MSDITETNTGSLADTNLSDKAVSYLRTIAPIVWGSVVTWLLANIPALSDLPIDLNNPTVVGFVVSGVIALWYVVWRAVEKHIPNWLTALVLGSSKQPAYVGTPGAPAVVVDAETDGTTEDDDDTDTSYDEDIPPVTE